MRRSYVGNGADLVLPEGHFGWGVGEWRQRTKRVRQLPIRLLPSELSPSDDPRSLHPLASLEFDIWPGVGLTVGSLSHACRTFVPRGFLRSVRSSAAHFPTLDHHFRRKDGRARVVGVLLGIVSDPGKHKFFPSSPCLTARTSRELWLIMRIVTGCDARKCTTG